MSIFINDIEFPHIPGASFGEYIARMPEIEPLSVMALRVQGESVSPLAVPEDGTAARILTYRHEEGRRIYERTLQFVLLLAIRRVLGSAQRVRIEHSLGQGVYVDLPGTDVTDRTAADIEAAMRSIVAEDVPFTCPAGTKRDAWQQFADMGFSDKVRLLNFRNFEKDLLVSADGAIDYFYGTLAPSAAHVPVFAVHADPPGLLLMMPDKANPSCPARRKVLPHLKALFAESNRWNDIQRIAAAADLNDTISEGRFRELVRVSEGL